MTDPRDARPPWAPDHVSDDELAWWLGTTEAALLRLDWSARKLSPALAGELVGGIHATLDEHRDRVLRREQLIP